MNSITLEPKLGIWQTNAHRILRMAVYAYGGGVACGGLCSCGVDHMEESCV